MNRIPFPTLGLTLLMIFTACSTTPAPPGVEDSESETQAAIAAAWRGHIAAAKKKDLAGVVAMYADHAVFIVPGATEIRGRPAIEQMEADGLATHDLIRAVHVTESLRVHGDTAYELGTVTGPVQRKGGEPRDVVWHFMALWERSPGRTWHVRYLIGR